MIADTGLDAALAAVRARIAGAGGRDVTIVGVTKGFGVEAWAAAVDAGVADVGENYAQDVVAKAQAWPAVAGSRPRPRLHFIGQLQTNKVRALAGQVTLWQSLDREAVIDEVAHRDPGAAVLIQVNLTGEEHKGGCAPIDVLALVKRAEQVGLDVRGLMGVGPEGDPERARPGFARLRALVDDLGLVECSMGMSADLEVAVAEGATIVRVGTALFGPRPGSMGQDERARRQP